MTFEPSRAAAIEKLSIFVENGLLNYSKSRNFDYGPEKRSNISCLSPYITHGVINEQEVISVNPAPKPKPRLIDKKR